MESNCDGQAWREASRLDAYHMNSLKIGWDGGCSDLFQDGWQPEKRRRTMAKFVVIGERLSTTAPAINRAFTERDPEPILKRAKQQLDAGATYLDVNI